MSRETARKHAERRLGNGNIPSLQVKLTVGNLKPQGTEKMSKICRAQIINSFFLIYLMLTTTKMSVQINQKFELGEPKLTTVHCVKMMQASSVSLKLHS